MPLRAFLRAKIGYNRQVWWLLLGLFIIGSVLNLLQLTSSLYTMQVYDRVLTSRSGSTLLALTVLAVLLILISGILEICRSFILNAANHWLDLRWSREIFDAIFKAGGIAGSQPVRDFETVRSFWMGSALVTVLDVPFIPILLMILFIIHPAYGFLGIVSLLIILGLAAWQALLSARGLEDASRENVKSYAFLDSALKNSDVTEAMGMRDNIFKRWLSQHNTMIELQGSASRVAGVFSAGIKSIQIILASIFVMGLGALLAIEQSISPGAMIVASFLMARALAPGLQAVALWQQGINARAAYRRLTVFLASIPGDKVAMKLPRPQGALRISDLSVVLPGTNNFVLQNISASLDPGELMAVIGPSAAGKTTFARATLGLLTPKTGSARLDGADIAQIPRHDLGAYVGYLPQDVELFEGTIAENIARLGEADPRLVVEAAQIAGVHELILHLPQGYDTVLGMSGQGLSPGQKQRIGLARAIYGFPHLIVLDEPDSNLDSEGQLALINCLRTLKLRRASIILISHRSTLVQEADKVLILSNGRVQRFGLKADVLISLNNGRNANIATMARNT